MKHSKKILSVFLSLLMLFGICPFGSFAAEATYTKTDTVFIGGGNYSENISWLVDDSNTLYISGEGEMVCRDNESQPWDEYKNTIETVIIFEGVTSTGNGAFRDFEALTQVVLPEGLTYIGIKSFYNCRSLINISLPSSVKIIEDSAFCGCSSLTELVLPENLYRINGKAFYECSQLVNVMSNDLLSYIGEYAFYGCLSLKSLEFTESAVEIGKSAFESCRKATGKLDLSGVRSIGESAFCDSGIEGVTLSTKDLAVKCIFKRCKNLSYVTVSDNPSGKNKIIIGEEAFNGCESLSELGFFEGVYEIGKYGFAGCSSLRDVSAFANAQIIHPFAFKGCTAIKKFRLNGNIVTLNSGIFKNCTSLTDVNTENLTTIGSDVFSGCTNLENVNCTAVKRICENAFKGCTILKNITLSKSISKIENCAFKDCRELEKLTVPNGGCVVAAPTESDGIVSYTIEKYTTIVSEPGSTLDEYAFTYGINFEDIKERKIKDISVYTKPNKTCYLIGTDNTLKIDGLSVLIEFEDGVKSKHQCRRDEIEFDESLLSVGGSHSVRVNYKNKSAKFSVICGDDIRYSGNTSIFEKASERILFTNNEAVRFLFTPQTTGERTFVRGKDQFFAYSDPEGNGSFSYRKNIGQQITLNFKAGETYTFLVHSPTSISAAEDEFYIYNSDFEDCFLFEELEDGNYKITSYIGGTYPKDFFVPAEHNGKPVTEIADELLTVTSGIERIHIPASIRKIGKKSFYLNYSLKEIVFDGVSSLEYIGESAFEMCGRLEKVTLPNSVKTIENRAFFACSMLNSVHFGENTEFIGDDVFSGRITDANIPNSLIHVGKNAYSYVENVTFENFPEKLTYIGENAFYNVDEFEEIALTQDIEFLGANAFYGCTGVKNIILPETLSEIPLDCFCGLTALEKADLSNVKIIGSGAFRECASLKTVIFSDSLEIIRNNAFSACTSLSGDITLGGSVTEIGSGAFENTGIKTFKVTGNIGGISASCFLNCVSLRGVYLPETEGEIGASAFYGCENLREVSMKNPKGIVSDYAFYNCKYFKGFDKYTNFSYFGIYAFAYSGITKLNIKNTDIADIMINAYAFKGCTALKEVSASADILYIENNAFEGCTELLNFVADKSDTSLRDYVFKDCEKLENAVFGSYISLSCTGAFENCKSLTSFEIGSKAETTGSYTFSGCDSLEKVIFKGKSIYFCPDAFPEGTIICAYSDSDIFNTAQENGFKTEPLPAHTHSFTVKTTGKRTCNGTLIKTYTCSCGYTYSEKEALSGHIIDNPDGEVITAPTCTTVGRREIKCLCGKQKTIEKIPALGHDIVITKNAIAPTHTKPGRTQGCKCRVCGEVLSVSTVIDPVDYDISFDEKSGTTLAIKTFPATSSKNGTRIAITFKSNDEAVTSTVKETVIYKVGQVILSKSTYVYDTKTHKPNVTVKDYKGKAVSKDNYTVKYSSSGKKIGEYTVTISFKGNYSGTKTLKYKVIPGQVAGLKASAVKTSSIKLTWTKVGGAKYYKVEKYNASTGKWKTVKTVTTNFLTVSSLKAGTKYQFRVTSLDGTKKFSGKTSAILKTATLTSAPNVSVKASKAKTATIKWKKVTGASKYIVYKSTDGKKFTKVTETAKLTYTLTKLTAGKKIYIKVAAVNAYGRKSAYSAVKSATVKK